MFRKTAYFVAYGEGWGLYAERLGYDMGLYDDPYDHMGQLACDMWRAGGRLVVDTGACTARAGAGTGRSSTSWTTRPRWDVVNEIDRHRHPGRALAYKIGQMKISGAVRKRKGRPRTGAKFDLRAYGDAVPENRLRRWTRWSGISTRGSRARAGEEWRVNEPQVRAPNARLLKLPGRARSR